MLPSKESFLPILWFFTTIHNIAYSWININDILQYAYFYFCFLSLKYCCWHIYMLLHVSVDQIFFLLLRSILFHKNQLIFTHYPHKRCVSCFQVLVISNNSKNCCQLFCNVVTAFYPFNCNMSVLLYHIYGNFWYWQSLSLYFNCSKIYIT